MAPRPFLRFEAQAKTQAKNSIDSGRVFRKAPTVHYAEFVLFDVGGSIGRVEQKSTGIRVQGNRHGIYGKIAPLEIVEDHGGRNLRWAPRLFMHLRPAHGDLNPDSIGELHLSRAQSIIQIQDFNFQWRSLSWGWIRIDGVRAGLLQCFQTAKNSL